MPGIDLIADPVFTQANCCEKLFLQCKCCFFLCCCNQVALNHCALKRKTRSLYSFAPTALVPNSLA